MFVVDDRTYRNYVFIKAVSDNDITNMALIIQRQTLTVKQYMQCVFLFPPVIVPVFA